MKFYLKSWNRKNIFVYSIFLFFLKISRKKSRIWSKNSIIWSKIMPFIRLLFILHYYSVPLWSFTTLLSPLLPTISFLVYPTLPILPFPSHYPPFLLSILHYILFSSPAWTTIPSLYPTLPRVGWRGEGRVV